MAISDLPPPPCDPDTLTRRETMMTKAEYGDSTVRLRPDADTSHEQAKDWYAAYGWHLSTNAGDISLQAVKYDWLDDDDDAAIVAKIIGEYGKLDENDAIVIVHQAASVREMAEEVEGLLADAVKAYQSGDLDATIEALDTASSRESDAGDDPATKELARRLLEEVDD
jgi:hypothetical protein